MEWWKLRLERLLGRVNGFGGCERKKKKAESKAPQVKTDVLGQPTSSLTYGLPSGGGILPGVGYGSVAIMRVKCPSGVVCAAITLSKSASGTLARTSDGPMKTNHE